MSIYDRDWYRESNKPAKTCFFYSPKKMLIAVVVIWFFVFLLRYAIDYFLPVNSSNVHIQSAPTSPIVSVPDVPNVPVIPKNVDSPQPSNSRSTQTVSYRVLNGVKYIDVEVNGVLLPFVFDTGASNVSLNSDSIRKLGISSFDFKRYSSTANGITFAYDFKCSSVKIGSIELKDVDCSYLPNSSVNLLGNSFLSHFSYTIDESSNTITMTCKDCDPVSSVSGFVEINGKKYVMKGSSLVFVGD